MDFILIAVLTLLNAVFAMSEMALTTSRKGRLAAAAEAGEGGADAALELHDHPTRFLSTVQVGITSIGMLNGIVGEAAFSDTLARFLRSYGAAPRLSEIAATTIVVAVITFITLIFGELVPKRIGQLYPEPVARLTARPMLWLSRAAGPFVRLLTFCTLAMLRLLRVDVARQRQVTEEEIAASLAEGVDAGLIEAHEHQMVRNVFHLDDRSLPSLMVPRSEIQWLDASHTVAEGLQHAGAADDRAAHSWYPVCRGGLDEVVGVISVARMLALRAREHEALASHMMPAVFIPESLSAMELIGQFRARAARVLFVVDEYGEVQGLLTPYDVLEAITGELQPQAGDDAWAMQQPDGSWLLDGSMPVAELKARLAIEELPDEERNRYNTVAGLLMALTGRVPQAQEQTGWGDWTFQVIALDGRRVTRVLARPIGAAAISKNAQET